MGHTLVAIFTEQSERCIFNLLAAAGAENACKIPFGRNCDRTAADLVMEHHITLFHWAKCDDEKYLKNLIPLQNIHPCSVTAVKPVLYRAEEGSYLICLEVRATPKFTEMVDAVGQCLGMHSNGSFHITLDATLDENRAQQLYHSLKGMDCFPMKLNVGGLHLYKIWSPVKLVKRYPIHS